MAGPRNKGDKPKYRWRAFTHWLNLAFVATAGIAGAVWDPSIWFLAVPLEAGILWMLPDVPTFRAAVDREVSGNELLRERAYYLEQLFGLQPEPPRGVGARIKGWFTEAPPQNVDTRIIDRGSAPFRDYFEMRKIITKLKELDQVRGVSIPERDIKRFEQVVNGYLRFVLATRSLAQALHGMDAPKLQREIDEVNAKLAVTALDPRIRTVLIERKRLKEAQIERLPKLHATLELFKTRADAIVYQLRNIQSQVLTDPGVDVNAFLEDLVERQEIMSDPIGALEADQLITELLNPQASARAEAAAEASRRTD